MAIILNEENMKETDITFLIGILLDDLFLVQLLFCRASRRDIKKNILSSFCSEQVLQ